MNRKEHDKKYRQSDKGKDSQKKYSQSHKGKICRKISAWKHNATKKNPNHKGLICESREDYELVYFTWLNSERCENCNCEYSKDNFKCMDHCHDTGLFRNILCFNCNKNLNCNNKSGIPNIYKYNCGWLYKRTINGKTHSKCSKDLEWLKNYKKQFELKYIYIH